MYMYICTSEIQFNSLVLKKIHPSSWFFVLTGMPRPVLGESCTTSRKDFTIFPPHQKEKNKSNKSFGLTNATV